MFYSVFFFYIFTSTFIINVETDTHFNKDITKFNEVNNNHKIIDYLYKINEGQKLVYDMCEVLDETYSIISGSNKPSCEYNISYINKTDILVYPLKSSLRTFFQTERKNFCKKQTIECGELVIIIKLYDLINSAIKLSIDNKNSDDLWINLEIINFDELFHLYKHSLTNFEILTNITLAKQKANVILEIEKNKIRTELSKTWTNSMTNKLSIYLGDPINNSLNYVSGSIGDLFSNTIEHAIPNLSIEIKVIIIMGLIIVLKKF